MLLLNSTESLYFLFQFISFILCWYIYILNFVQLNGKALNKSDNLIVKNNNFFLKNSSIIFFKLIIINYVYMYIYLTFFKFYESLFFFNHFLFSNTLLNLNFMMNFTIFFIIFIFLNYFNDVKEITFSLDFGMSIWFIVILLPMIIFSNSILTFFFF